MHARPAGARAPAAGRDLAGFIPWYLKRRNPALETSEDFFDRLLLGGGCLLMLDGLDEVVSRTDRSQVRQQVEDLVHDIYPGNQVLVTAREGDTARTLCLAMTLCAWTCSAWTTSRSARWWATGASSSTWGSRAAH